MGFPGHKGPKGYRNKNEQVKVGRREVTSHLGSWVPTPNLDLVTGSPAIQPLQPPERAEPRVLPAQILPNSGEEAAARAPSGWQPQPAPTGSRNGGPVPIQLTGISCSGIAQLSGGCRG